MCTLIMSQLIYHRSLRLKKLFSRSLYVILVCVILGYLYDVIASSMKYIDCLQILAKFEIKCDLPGWS